MMRFVRSSAVKLVPVLKRKGAPPVAAGVRSKAVNLLTKSVATAFVKEYVLVAMTSSCGRSNCSTKFSTFCRLVIESVTSRALLRAK